MDLETLLLGLIDTIRGSSGGSRDAAGLLAPLFGGLGPAAGQVRNTAGGARSSSVGGDLLGGLVSGGVLGSAIPLLGLFGLTGRSVPEPAEERVRFELPSANRAELGFDASTGALSRVDYGDRQTVRPASSTPAPQINIHVSALDSKSFADRSGEIADAVRSAMLQSHALTDTFVED